MNSAFDLTGKNAIITGGNGGIGLGIGRAIAEAGANIAILCRDMEKAKNAIEKLSIFNVKVKAYFCDITIPATVRKAVADVCEDFGNIDILINNSGAKCNSLLLDMDEDITIWREIIETDLTGMAQMTYEVAKRMRDAGKGGSIVNITSNAGAIVNKGIHITPYSVAKAGANHFTRAMAVELGEYDIRVNAIAPGFTNLSNDGERKDALVEPGSEMDTLVYEQHANKRRGETIENGALAVFLCSPAAAHITGEVVTIDGGYTLIK